MSNEVAFKKSATGLSLFGTGVFWGGVAGGVGVAALKKAVFRGWPAVFGMATGSPGAMGVVGARIGLDVAVTAAAAALTLVPAARAVGFGGAMVSGAQLAGRIANALGWEII